MELKTSICFFYAIASSTLVNTDAYASQARVRTIAVGPTTTSDRQIESRVSASLNTSNGDSQVFAASDIYFGTLKGSAHTDPSATSTSLSYAELTDKLAFMPSQGKFVYLDWSIEGTIEYGPQVLLHGDSYAEAYFAGNNIANGGSFQFSRFAPALASRCVTPFAYGCQLIQNSKILQTGTLVLPTDRPLTLTIGLFVVAQPGDALNISNTMHLLLRDPSHVFASSESGVFLAGVAPSIPEPTSYRLFIGGLFGLTLVRRRICTVYKSGKAHYSVI